MRKVGCEEVRICAEGVMCAEGVICEEGGMFKRKL